MAITKAKKVELSEGLTKKLDGVQSIAFVHFNKLPMTETMALRRSLRKDGVGFTVIKKTLMKRVLESKGIKGTYPELAGEIGIAYSTDQLAAARGVYEFSKTHKENCALVGGVFEGEYKTQSDMMVLATIPSREVLLSQIAFLLKSPIQRLAISLNEVSKKKTA